MPLHKSLMIEVKKFTMKGGDREMKKKLTIGVFLALAVVLVASIVGVGIADAAKPPQLIGANVTYVSNDNGTCNVSVYLGWENYSAKGCTLKLQRQDGIGGLNIETIVEDIIWFESGNNRSGELLLVTVPNEPCGWDYFTNVRLIKKNGNQIPMASTFMRVTADCPVP